MAQSQEPRNTDNQNFDYYDFTSFPKEKSAPEVSAEEPSAAATATVTEEAPVTPPDRKPIVAQGKRAMLRIGLGTLTLEAVWMTVATLASVAVAVLAQLGVLPATVTESWQYLFLINTLPLYVVALPLYYLVISGAKPYRPEKKKLGAGPFFILLLITFTVFVGGSFIGNGLMKILSTVVGYNYENSVDTLADMPIVASFLLTVVLAPVVEEFIFRKLLLERLAPYGEAPAILIVGITFGLYHGNFYQFFYAALFGILLSYIYLRTGHLGYTIAFHALANFLLGILPMLLQDLIDYDALLALTTEEAQAAYIVEHIGAYLLMVLYSFLEYGAALAGLVLLIVFWSKKHFEKRECELSRREYKGAFINVGTVLALLFFIGNFALSLLPL